MNVQTNDKVVSFDDEQLILVDSDDRIVGYESKASCHDGEGRLHRAFSVFLFDGEGRMLLQQRSAEKRLWPMIWSNACCSHPRRNEEMDDAARRRTREELGVEVEPEFLFKFQYHATYEDRGSENELCSVFIARCDEDPVTNVNEIHATRKLTIAELETELAENGDHFSPWFKIEWKRLREEYMDRIEGLWREGGAASA